MLQTEFAKTLQLGVTPVPSRTHLDRAAEYITCLGLIAGTTGKIAKEIYTLCKQEFGEAGEPVPEGAGQFDDASEAKSRNGPRPDG